MVLSDFLLRQTANAGRKPGSCFMTIMPRVVFYFSRSPEIFHDHITVMELILILRNQTLRLSGALDTCLCFAEVGSQFLRRSFQRPCDTRVERPPFATQLPRGRRLWITMRADHGCMDHQISPDHPIPEVVGITVHLTFASRAYQLARSPLLPSTRLAGDSR